MFADHLSLAEKGWHHDYDVESEILEGDLGSVAGTI